MAQSNPWGAERIARPATPVDLDHLARQTHGDAHVEREALQLFVVQSRIYLARLRAAVRERERSDTVHALKGSASAVGAWRVAALSAEIEELRAEGGDARYLDMLEELGARVDEVRSFVDRMLTEH